MKKLLFIFILLSILLLIGCTNQQTVDYSVFTTARISNLSNSESNSTYDVKIKVCKEYGSSLYIESDDGRIFLTDKSNVLLIKFN